jgi:homogentisate 1,2-dioxygenase
MLPQVKGTVTRQAHVGVPEGTFEEEHGRQGFFGRVSHLYHTNPPTGWTRIEGPLKPQAFWLDRLKPADAQDPANGRPLPVLGNDDVTISVSRLVVPMPYFFRNADGDEVVFVHQGEGVLETDYGPLAYRPGDYLVIPRGTTYRLVPAAGESFFLVIESREEIRQPDRGILGQHALYDPAVIRTPEPQAHVETGEFEVRIKREGRYTKVFYPFHPLDVVGWKGDLTVWQLNIADLRPVMSHRAHLAPSVHSTLIGGGAFVICTFVPRPLERDRDAQRVPFYHRNIDYDEVIFYHAGNFFSRDNIGPGMLTFHPQGIHHGPHPQAFANQFKNEETDEYAVMVDTRRPLHVLPGAISAEFAEYHRSWGG